MLKILLSIAFVANKSNAQNNIVPNNSFEDTTSCPTTSAQIIKAVPWFAATNGTPDYYNTCATFIDATVPSNTIGYQQPITGNAYAGIAIGLPPIQPNYREYIEVQLDSTLKAGKKYCVWFYVSLANGSKYAVDTLGVYLSDTSIFVNTTGPLPFNPQIKNKNGIISDTLSWIEVSGEYIALGGEQYITIGIFNNDATVNQITVSGSYDEAYYYIDDITVIACNGLGVGELSDTYKIKIYPNPSDGNMQLEYELKNNKLGEFIIYDVTGRKAASYILQQGKKTLQINATALQNGIYYYSFIADGETVKSDKLIIIK